MPLKIDVTRQTYDAPIFTFGIQNVPMAHMHSISYNTSMKKVLITAGIVILAGVTWYLGSPLFLNEIVEEAFPSTENTTKQSDEETLEMMQNLTVREVDAMPEETRTDMKNTMDVLSKKMQDTVMHEQLPESSAEEPLQFSLIAQGSFADADSIHKGSGTATIYAFPDASEILRFENFSVTNGPALHVFLTKNTDGTKDAEAYDLGTLKGNKGNQNYDIPADIDIGEFKSVLIYCVPFKVPFAVATLQQL